MNNNDTKNNWENRQTEELLAGKIDRSTDCAAKPAEKAVNAVKNGVKQTVDTLRDGAIKATEKVGNAIDTAADRLHNKTNY